MAFSSLLGLTRRAASLLGGGAGLALSRGYRTGRFTQKMGRKHYKGRGAKSFGFLTSKSASATSVSIVRVARPSH